jgi:hypothetical protein
MNRPLTIPMLARAEQLRLECNLSYRAIAAVLELDYGQQVNLHTLRYNLRLRGVPPDLRRQNGHFNGGQAAA